MADTELPLVMIWRRTSNLEQARAAADKMLSLKLIGAEEDKLMYDAGSVILAFWGQNENEEQFAIASEKLVVGGGGATGGIASNAARFLSVANQCGGMNLSRVPLVTNPALNMRFMMNNVEAGPGAALSNENDGVGVTPASDELGKSLPFYDDDGNLFSVSQFDEDVAASAGDEVGRAMKSIKSSREGESVHLAATTLLVSNVVKSAEFYRETLGFKQLGATNGVATFDVGGSVLRLQPEPTPRTVRSLFRSGRLNGDWLVFHTKSIADTVKKLQGAGVSFPLEIEESATGQLAYFTDPDGSSLVLWEPPEKSALPDGYINFFPVLNRLLSAA